MNEHLVIRLGAAPGHTAAWVAVDQTGALLGAVGSGSLTDAVPLAAGREVTVLVPALDVVRMRAEVPTKGRGKVMQLLPFALEEQLAEDIDMLHFASGRRDADGRIPVAVVRRNLMDEWLRRLHEAGLVASHIYSEGDALGSVPNTAILLVESHCAILAESDGNVTAMDTEGLEELLDLWLSRRRATDESSTPGHLVVYGSPDLLARLDPVWERLATSLETIELRGTGDGALPRLAAQVVTTPGIDLLQGTFGRRSALIALTPAWRVAASFVLALVVLAFAVQIAELRNMRREIASLDADIDQAFHYVFPDAGPVQDARGQLSSRLQELGDRSAGGTHEFLDALRIIAQAMSGNAAARVEAFNYRSGTLELRVRAPDVQTLDRIQQRVTEAGGLTAQIQSANAAGNEVVGRLQITRTKG
jgi:general secretion pathway protein L